MHDFTKTVNFHRHAGSGLGTQRLRPLRESDPRTPGSSALSLKSCITQKRRPESCARTPSPSKPVFVVPPQRQVARSTGRAEAWRSGQSLRADKAKRQPSKHRNRQLTGPNMAQGDRQEAWQKPDHKNVISPRGEPESKPMPGKAQGCGQPRSEKLVKCVRYVRGETIGDHLP